MRRSVAIAVASLASIVIALVVSLLGVAPVPPDLSRPGAASASTTSVNAAWSARTGVMSLKTTPGSG